MSSWKSRARELSRTPRALRVIDGVTSVGVRIAAPPYKLYSSLGPAKLPTSTRSLKRMGLFPLRDHYYSPMFNDAHLTQPLSDVRALPGIDWRHDDQVALLGELTYADELRELHLDRPAGSDLEFSLANGSFGSGDAEILYSMIRRQKPRRIFEIGSGNSTKVARLAVERNDAEGAEPCDHVCVEPYEMAWLEGLGVRVIRERVEKVGAELFSELGAGDILFIDSSHIIRPQGDVLFEFLELLPSLASGVVVHVHDIFSPRDYPDDWVRTRVRMWNEQYLLEALLSNSEHYEVVAALNYLKHSEYDALSAACPYLTPDREPGSFWLRVR